MNSTVRDVMRQAVRQTGYMESPAGSNRTKFGKQFGMNGVPWCAEFVWASGENAAGTNPIAKSANAAGIQDLTVSKGGSWVLKKTTSNKTKKAGLPKIKLGDIVSFDFGRNNGIRQHTGFALGRDGDYYICIEGNTSTTDRGSQSNGGCVAIRKRHYTQVCAIARPAYGSSKKPVPTTPYTGKIPALPKRGFFKRNDKGTQVMVLQRALNWAAGEKLLVDGEFGGATLAAVVLFQSDMGIAPDGQFGKESLAKLKALIKDKDKPTKAEMILDKAVALSYPLDTPKKKYAFEGGAPKATYKAALDKIFPDHGKWKKQIRTGASCSVFVATVMRSTIDKSFMCDDPCKVYDYLKDSPKWEKVNSGIKPTTLKAGDVICYHKPNHAGHILIYKGGGYIIEANFGRYYPHRAAIPKAYNNATYIANTYKRFGVFRVKE